MEALGPSGTSASGVFAPFPNPPLTIYSQVVARPQTSVGHHSTPSTMDGLFTSLAESLGASADQIKVSIHFRRQRMIDSRTPPTHTGRLFPALSQPRRF
jgi:hypothetical protein